MNIRLIFSIFLVLIGMGAYGQKVDYNTIILPANTKDIDVEERLVQLAWQNDPANQIAIKRSEQSVVAMKQAQYAWLDYFAGRGNVNEFVLNPDNDPYGRAAFYPKYNFSVVITFGSLFNNALEVKRRRIESTIAVDEINARKLAVRSHVLQLYAAYSLAVERYKIQLDLEQNSQANLNLVEDNFKNGLVNVQVYNTALERHTNLRLRKLETQSEVKVAKIRVEEVIGVPLETVTGE